MVSVKRFPVKPIGAPPAAAQVRDAAADVEAFLGELPEAWGQEPDWESVTIADSPHWICLCFQTKGQKLEFLRGAGLDVDADQHADGRPFARLLAGERARPVPPPRRFSVTKLGAKPVPSAASKSDYQRRAQAERERFALTVGVDYWVAFCFPSVEERDACAVRLAEVRGVWDWAGPPGSRMSWFVDGLAVAANLGIPIATASPDWGEPRIRTRWQRYVG